MIPSLLLPAALGAVAAVLVPLAIHIARNTETRTIDFAALRWLDPNPQPVRRLRLDERRLLAVRIALIVAVALLLARPVLSPGADGRAVVAVSPDVDANTVADNGERRIWLSAGFPSLDRPRPATPANLASLIRQLDAELPGKTALTIVVPPEFTGADAGRLELSRKIDWRIAPAARRTASTPSHPPFDLVVRYARDTERAVRYFRAASIAWTEPGKTPAFDAAPTDQPLPKGARHLVWLSAAPMPAPVLDWIEAGGVVLLAKGSPSPVESAKATAWKDAGGAPLASAGRFGKGRVLQLAAPVEPATIPALVEPDFPDTLRSMLAPPPAPSRVASADYAPSVTQATGSNPHPVDLRPWLALVVALLLAVERWLATRRQRPVTA